MKKPKLYLETSVWNFYYADDAPLLRDMTLDFFEKIKQRKFEIFISDIVFKEISQAQKAKKELLEALIKRFKPVMIPLEEVAEKLAFDYIRSKVLPAKCTEDCRHAAIATVHELDVLISWNMKHLANYNRMQAINFVNTKNGYEKKLDLMTPMEMIEND